MNTLRLLPLLVLTAGLASGCDPDLVEDLDGDVVSLRPGGSGGIWLNTSSIGTQTFSEFDTSGVVHDGIRFTGLLIKRPNNVWLPATPELVDGNLRGKSGPTLYVGNQLLGSRWKFNLVDGAVETPVEIWIDGFTQVSGREARYTFKTLDGNGQTVPICAADGSGSIAAIPFGNVTVDSATGDMSARLKTIYLACTSGAVGKAIAWGYRPWERTLADFEAASRMVRADYCHDGMSWTENGTALQIRDKYNINTFVDASDPTEMVWTASGAACLGTPRNPLYSASTVTCNGQPLPTCPANVGMATYAGTLFWTKLSI